MALNRTTKRLVGTLAFAALAGGMALGVNAEIADAGNTQAPAVITVTAQAPAPTVTVANANVTPFVPGTHAPLQSTWTTTEAP